MDETKRDGRRVSAETKTIVKQYLNAMTTRKPLHGRRTLEWVQKRREQVLTELENDALDVLERLKLNQELITIDAELIERSKVTELDELEARFIKVAAEYSQARGISHAAWRAVGVPAHVLMAAGIR